VSTESAAAFWSYTQLDDTAERGRIRLLAEDLRAEYRLLTGGPLEIFLDQDAIEWGDDWRGRITDALRGTTFFIPIITPTYFQRPECRRELLSFAEQATELGVGELLLPVLYSPVQVLADDTNTSDEAVRLIRARQWEDWRRLRLEDRDSRMYRTGVHRLANRLASVMRHLTSRDGILQAQADMITALDIDETARHDSVFRLIVEGEDPVPRLQSAVGSLVPVLDRFEEIQGEARNVAKKSADRGNAVAGALRSGLYLVGRLDAPAAEVAALGAQLASDVLGLASTVSLLLDVVERNPRARLRDTEVSEFLWGLQDVAGAAGPAMQRLDALYASFESGSGYSRALRPSLRIMQQGLVGIRDAEAVLDGWNRRIAQVRQKAQSPRTTRKVRQVDGGSRLANIE
jgi:hypothetical protein